MEFYKMHGLGNDFIIFQSIEDKGEAYNQLAVAMCHRQLGVGADGIMVVLPSEKCDTRMRIINADGSEAEMCGNGIRCFAKYVYEQGIVKKDEFTVETLAGIMVPKLIVEEEIVTQVTVDMGEPITDPQRIPVNVKVEPVINQTLDINGTEVKYNTVLMGVPHTVIFTKDIEPEVVTTIGPIIEKHKVFPQKTNVNFTRVEKPDEITVRTWERGAGATLACGTGCCAAVVLGILSGCCERNVTVHLYEGDLQIQWDEQNNHVYMTGPATTVFKSEWNQ